MQITLPSFGAALPWLLLLLLLLQCVLPILSLTSNKEDFRVHGLEKVEPAFGTFEGEMYAGLLPIDEESGGKLMCTYVIGVHVCPTVCCCGACIHTYMYTIFIVLSNDTFLFGLLQFGSLNRQK
jgi:hypothetical protein